MTKIGVDGRRVRNSKPTAKNGRLRKRHQCMICTHLSDRGWWKDITTEILTPAIRGWNVVLRMRWLVTVVSSAIGDAKTQDLPSL